MTAKGAVRNFLRRDDLIAALEYIFVFVLLWVESSFFAVNFLTGTARLLISALLALAVVLVNIKKRIDLKLLYSGSALAAWILAVGLIHVSDGYRQTVIMFVFFMTGMLFALHFDREIFVRRYVGIMLFLSVYSTVTFAVSLFIPHNCGILPVVLERSNCTYYDIGFNIICRNTFNTRNYGMFWEPGAFAVFLTVALAFELLRDGKTDRNGLIKVAVLTLAIITTKSTLGIFTAGLVWLIYFTEKPVEKSEPEAKLRRKVLFAVLMIGIAALAFLPESFYHGVFSKLFPNTETGELSHSLTVRIDAVYYMLREFIGSFGLGIGVERFVQVQNEYCRGMATATMANWLAAYGIFFGGACIYGFIRLFFERKRGVIAGIVTVIFCCMLIVTENFMGNPFIYVLVFYGLGKTDYEKLPFHRDRKPLG